MILFYTVFQKQKTKEQIFENNNNKKKEKLKSMKMFNRLLLVQQ